MERVELGEREREVYEFFKRRFYLLAAVGNGNTGEQRSGTGTGRSARSASGSREAVAATRPGKRRQQQQSSSGKIRRRSAGNIVVLLSVLRRICDHGEALLPHTALEVWRNRDAGVLSWDVLEKAVEREVSCCICGQGVQVENGEDDGEKRGVDVAVEFPCGKHVACETCATPAADDAILPCPKCPAADGVSAVSTMMPCGVDPAYSPSSKVSALLRNIFATLKDTDSAGGDVAPVKRFVSFPPWSHVVLGR